MKISLQENILKSLKRPSVDVNKVNDDVVRSFFDNISERYSSFYENEKNLHNQRINIATADLSFSEKSILDIGAGTGALYNVIQGKGGCRKYHAIDLSSKMLSKSSIPMSNQFVESFYQFESEEKYDIIFALGLTNYLSISGNEDLKRFVLSFLSQHGIAVISYTNGASLINRFKSRLAKLLPGNNNRTLTSGVSNTFFNAVEVDSLWPYISKWCFFNHAFNGSHLCTTSPSKQFLFSDFLIVTGK